MIREPRTILEKTLTSSEQKGTYLNFGSSFTMGDSAGTVITESKKAFVNGKAKLVVYTTVKANSACLVTLYGKDSETGTEATLATFTIPVAEMEAGAVHEYNISDFAPRWLNAGVKGTTSVTSMAGKVRVEIVV